jgi:phosphate transport system permease protein
MHSRPGHHGWHLALWIVIPALLGISAWSSLSPSLIHSAVLADPAAASLPLMDMERNSILSEAYAIAQNPNAPVFNPDAEKLVPAIVAANQK